MSALKEVLPQALTSFRREKVETNAREYEEQGVPASLALQVAYCKPLASACDILRLAETLKVPVQEAGAMYFQTSYRFGCHWMREAARAIPVTSSWQQQALAAVVNDIYDAHSRLAGTILTQTPAFQGSTEERVEAWAATHPEPVASYDTLLQELRAEPVLDVPMVVVSSRLLGGLGR